MAKEKAKKATHVVAAEPQTSEKLKNLLDILNIKTVYYVDDENNLTDLDIQIVTGELEKIYGLGKEEELNVIHLDNWDRDLPKEGVIESIAQHWTGLDFEAKKGIYSQILKITDADNIQSDFKRSTLVGEQMPAEIIKILSPAQWDEEKTKLKDKLNNNQRVLILFDEELKLAGAKYTSTRGQDLIVEVKKMDVQDKVICTLLTHKISSAKEELKFRDELIEERPDKDLKENDFFPLAKQRLNEPEVFADGIKKALINGYFEAIKTHTVALIEHAYNEATKKIKAFDTYDFEDTILKTSVKDGVWEPETILRISNIVFDNELKSQMVKTGYVPKVNQEIKLSQPFWNFKFKVPENMQPYTDKLKLRHQEIFDSGEIINSLRKPLENGDIFQVGEEKYILVAQACDMAVRTKDTVVGLRTAKVATLLKIRTVKSKDFKDKIKTANYLSDKYPLKYFELGTEDIGVIEFTDNLIVDIDFLDFCVFNEKGECKLSLRNNIDKSYLSSTWEKRYDILYEKIKGYQVKIANLRKYLNSRNNNHFISQIRKFAPRMFRLKNRASHQGLKLSEIDIERELYPKFILASSGNVVDTTKIDSDGTFNFGAKRIAKYKDYGATYLLQRYTRHLSRIAEPHDFAFSKS